MDALRKGSVAYQRALNTRSTRSRAIVAADLSLIANNTAYNKTPTVSCGVSYSYIFIIRCQDKKARANRSQYVKGRQTASRRCARDSSRIHRLPSRHRARLVGVVRRNADGRIKRERARQVGSKEGGARICMSLLRPSISALKPTSLVVGQARPLIVFCPPSFRTRGGTPSDFVGVLRCPNYLQRSPAAID